MAAYAAPMNPLDLDRLRATPIATDPFAHILVPGFINPAALPAVLAALPPMRGRGSFPIEALRLGAPAKAMVAALEGEDFRAAIAAKFAIALAGAPVMTTLRGNAGPQDGRIHTDSAAKRVTILLYLHQPAGWAAREGCLRLLRGPANLEDYAVEIPPADGTLLVFPNGPTTWHGHKTFIGQRYVLQMNYMASSTKARAEMRRHHLSAFLKRLRRAA